MNQNTKCANDDLVQAIRLAFSDVELGNGISWTESEAIDAYADSATQMVARNVDAQRKWQELPLEKLDFSMGGDSFLDGEGVRFYMPAIMIAALCNKSADWPLYSEMCLFSCFLKGDRRNPAKLLNIVLREVVTRFLEWACLRYAPDEDFNTEQAMAEWNFVCDYLDQDLNER